MTTQSLRGMANHGPMHWRGDRTGGNDAASAQPERAARSTRTRRSRSSTRRSWACSAGARSSPPTRDAGVHRLHPAGHLSAEPDPQPRQLAHARAAGGPRPSSSGRSPTRFQDCDGCHAPDRRPATRTFGVAAPGFFGTDGRSTLRERDPDPQDPAPPQHVPEGRHVRHAGGAVRQSRRQRLQGRSGPRLRLPARRQRRHALPLPQRDASSTRAASIPAAFPPGAPGDPLRRQHRGVHDGLRQQPGADRRPADHAHEHATARRSIRASPCSMQRADAGECDLVAKGAGRRRASAAASTSAAATSRPTAPASRRSPTRRCARCAEHGGPGGDVHLRAARLGRPHRRRSRRRRLRRRRRARRRQRSGRCRQHPDGRLAGLHDRDARSSSRSATSTTSRAGCRSAPRCCSGATRRSRSSATVGDSDGAIFAGGVAGNLIVPKGTGFKYKAPRGTIGITDVTRQGEAQLRRHLHGDVQDQGRRGRSAAPTRTRPRPSITLNVGGACFRGNAKHVR